MAKFKIVYEEIRRFEAEAEFTDDDLHEDGVPTEGALRQFLSTNHMDVGSDARVELRMERRKRTVSVTNVETGAGALVAR